MKIDIRNILKYFDGDIFHCLLSMYIYITTKTHIDGLVQERRNSIANALELWLSCTDPLILCIISSVSIFSTTDPDKNPTVSNYMPGKSFLTRY